MKYYLFCKIGATKPALFPVFIGRQSDGFGRVRWGIAVYFRGATLAFGIERNDGPFWRIATLR